jgi:membrane-bound ClpP family serine protease
LKRSFMVLGIVGILLVLFGTGFALQGDGILPGSMMSGVTFWLYAGSVIAVIGVVVAVVGFMMGSKKEKPKTVAEDKQGAPTRPDSSTH